MQFLVKKIIRGHKNCQKREFVNVVESEESVKQLKIDTYKKYIKEANQIQENLVQGKHFEISNYYGNNMLELLTDGSYHSKDMAEKIVDNFLCTIVYEEIGSWPRK